MWRRFSMSMCASAFDDNVLVSVGIDVGNVSCHLAKSIRSLMVYISSGFEISAATSV